MNEAIEARQLLNRLRLRQVALLLSLRDRGTLGAAATDLGMTQSAATKMLQELEAALACRLVQREGRGLRLTAAGEAVLGHFEGLRGAMAGLARDLLALREGGAGALAVGSILAPSPTVLTRALAALKREQPRLRLSVLTETSDQLLSQLERGSLDVVIGRLTDGHTRRHYLVRPLEAEALSAVVGPQHPLARARRVALAELTDLPWILQPRGSPMREVLEQEFRGQGLDIPADLIETASILTTCFLIAEAPMVTVVPTALAERFAAQGMLKILPLKLQVGMEPYGSIVRRGRPLSAAAQRFLDLVHGEAGGAAQADGAAPIADASSL